MHVRHHFWDLTENIFRRHSFVKKLLCNDLEKIIASVFRTGRDKYIQCDVKHLVLFKRRAIIQAARRSFKQRVDHPNNGLIIQTSRQPVVGLFNNDQYLGSFHSLGNNSSC